MFPRQELFGVYWITEPVYDCFSAVISMVARHAIIYFSLFLILSTVTPTVQLSHFPLIHFAFAALSGYSESDQVCNDNE